MDRREDVGEVYPGGGFAGGHGGAIEDIVAELAELSNVSRELAQRIDGKVDKGDFAALELGDGATQKEVRQMLQNVLGKLKGLSACAAAMLSFAAFAIEPDIAWEDMLPTNKVKDVVAEFAPEPDFSTSNDTLVATIEATAPAPGDYAAVSNAAMQAQFLAWYPDGSVKNYTDCTPEWDGTTGIKYDWEHSNITNHTVSVLTFGQTSTGKDNSHLKGHIVIPPYVEHDGTKYIVTTINSGTLNSEGNTNACSIVAPTTLTTVKGESFRNCYSLESISLPGVIDLSRRNFLNCTSLVSVVLTSAKSMGDYQFQYCSSLKSIHFPSLEATTDTMFGGCTSLTTVSMPAVKKIGYGTFMDCPILTAVSLPSVTNISNRAFSSSRALDYIDFGSERRASVPTLAALTAFPYPPSGNGCKIIVPDEQYDDWVAANRWSSLFLGGYRFLRHSEWEYARRYEIPAVPTKTSELANDGDGTAKYATVTDVAAVASKSEADVAAVASVLDEKVRVAPVEIPAGCTDVDKHGCVHNAPVELGQGAKASVDLSGLNNATCRVVSVAIGAGADASNPGKPETQQGIAVGASARAKGVNAIAIGAGVKHEDEDDLTGDNAYAGANEAIAGGYSAKATASAAVAWGSRAKATAQGAWQLGEGSNTVAKSLKFREWQLLDGNGQIPTNRLQDALSHLPTPTMYDRLISAGNMAVTYGVEDEQVVEPQLNGLNEVVLLPGTNGVFMAGAMAGVEPPLGSRNFDMVITNIPQAYCWQGGELVPVAAESNFQLAFDELPDGIDVRLYADSSIGYVSGRSIVVTNAPLRIKMRQPNASRVIVSVKPWDEAEL